MERIKYGELKNMTPEEIKQHKADISKRWRLNNAKKVSKTNHDWYVFYKRNPRFESVCKICGDRFMSSRKNAKICPKCLKKRRVD